MKYGKVKLAFKECIYYSRWAMVLFSNLYKYLQNGVTLLYDVDILGIKMHQLSKKLMLSYCLAVL